MLSIAYKMLVGNRTACLGIIFGIFLATLLISQQSAIFLGLIARSYRIVSNIPSPNLWIMDPSTESDEKVRPLPEGYLHIVRSIPGIDWAAPLNYMFVPMSTRWGIFHISQLYGIDDATFTGAPSEMLEGNILDLHRQGAVIIDKLSAEDILAKTSPGGAKIPLKLGDYFEINNRQAVVVGICKVIPGFFPQPIVFTSNHNFNYFVPLNNSQMQFIIAKTRPNADVKTVLDKINAYSMLNGLTSDEFKRRIAKSFLKTGIFTNFALSVGLGIIIGFSIAGQLFYMMTLQNANYYALIKAIGGNQKIISKIIIMQTILVGVIGYLLGTGVTILWGWAIENTTLTFLFPWQLLLFTAVIVLTICIFTAGLSINKVLKTDPHVLLSG